MKNEKRCDERSRSMKNEIYHDSCITNLNSQRIFRLSSVQATLTTHNSQLAKNEQ